MVYNEKADVESRFDCVADIASGMEPINNNYLQKLERFMGGLPVKKLPELFDYVFDGLAVVPVWLDSVVEGVDMWFKGEQVDSIPRFRMKLKVRHGDHAAVFALFDKDVQTLAIETCPLLLSMGESSSLYPDEI
ncbi:DNA helicase [Trifolium repens]|nr:DNA helicase [Trifolium repens]